MMENSENPVEVDREYGLDEEAESSINIYKRKVPCELVPSIGQQFDTVDDALSFYNDYAKVVGFSVRKSTTKKEPESCEIKRKEFVCYKIGRPSIIADVGVRRRRGSVGEDCKAKLAVLKSNNGKYVVTVFNEGHSHPLSSPKESHLLRSHRDVSAVAKCLSRQMDVVNIPKHKQFSLLEVQSGGIENVGFTKRDLYNYNRDVRAELKGHDGELLYEYMKLEQGKNPSFIFKIETNDDNKITRCFWSDASSRRAYKFFGDVLIFDTTYDTNRYGLIFAPIMGVNNHGQTVIFACAFLNHETVDDFVWLFSNFMEAMPGDAPKMIITDQDPAMSKALPLVLPDSIHRYCIWHILKKFCEKVDSKKYSAHKEEFSKCIWNSETREEFDLEWQRVIDSSQLRENRWLNDLYDIRSKWVPAYVNHVFSANMSSSQRAESGHAFFKSFVSKNNSLVDFMIRFCRGLVHRRHQELIADHKDKVEKPKLKVPHHFLVQMVDIYTREMFHKFQDELCDSFNYRFQFIREDDKERVYRVQIKNVETRKSRELIYDKVLQFASCSCRKFDSAGIPCRHIIAYLNKYEDLDLLPDKYILKRWTKSAKLLTVEDNYGVQIVDDSSYLLMRSQLTQSYLDVVDKSLVFEETRKMFTDALSRVSDEIEQYVNMRTSGKVDSEENITVRAAASTQASCNFGGCYKEPDMARAKGCGKRLKGAKENAMRKEKNKKDRRCHGCNKVGQSHDKRNCPALLNVSLKMGMNDANMVEGDYSSSEEVDERI